MRIQRLRAKNYCQHRDLDIGFHGTTIGVVGRNNRGKTNMVRAIQDALTGKFSKPKGKTITHGETEGWIEVEFRGVSDVPHSIWRDLASEKVRLVDLSTGETVAKTSSSVQEAMRELIPVDPDVLRHIVFTPQEDVLGLLFKGSAARERLAMSFFGVERAKEIEKALGEILSTMPVSVSDGIPETLTELEAELSVLMDERNLILSELEETEPRILPAERVAALEAVAALDGVAESTARSLESLEARIAEIESATLEVEAKISNEQEILGDFSVADARARLARDESTREMNRRRADLEARIALLGDNPGPDLVAGLEDEVAMLDREIRDIQAAISKEELTRDLRVRMLESGIGSGEACPCCLSPLDEGGLDRIRETIPELDRSIGDGNARVAPKRLELEKVRADLREIEHRAVSDAARRDSLLDQIASLPPPADTMDADTVARLKEDVEAAMECLDAISSLEIEHGRLVGTGNELREQIRSIRSGMPESFPSREEIQDALDQLSVHREAASSVREARAALKSLEDRIASTETRIGLLRGRLAEARTVVRQRDFIQKVRARFHYTAAPQIVIRNRMLSIQGRIDHYLGMLGTDYRVRVLDGFDFQCEFLAPDGSVAKTVDSSDLSGGEKVDLSTAFRLAAGESFCSGVGFMALDEPTVWLDRETVQNMVGILERLKELGDANGSQFLVVTHERALMDHFDQVIEI